MHLSARFYGPAIPAGANSAGFAAPVCHPYRVINRHGCNGSCTDPHDRFDHKDFLWCPRHAGTRRQFECTRLITAEQVKQTIRRVPGFGVHDPKMSVVANSPSKRSEGA